MEDLRLKHGLLSLRPVSASPLPYSSNEALGACTPGCPKQGPVGRCCVGLGLGQPWRWGGYYSADDGAIETRKGDGEESSRALVKHTLR